jgi:glycosyltransferase involved in cell wall biosynthesis
MRFSIVTPSFRQGQWLRLCIASVADQDIPQEHIVQDAGSDDGTLDWLPGDARVTAHIEKDSGMYDAVNRGLRRARGEFLAYLNCDEQYLPGALRRVEDYFDAHPRVDVLFGDVVVADENGDYVAHRKMQVPLKYHTWTCHLSTLTCGTFFRRSLVERGFLFDASWRSGGDGEWMVRLLQAGVPMAAPGFFTSVFTRTGANLGTGPVAVSEANRLRATAPLWARIARPVLILHHRLRRWTGGMYQQEPFSFEIYTKSNPEVRQLKQVRQPRSWTL